MVTERGLNDQRLGNVGALGSIEQTKRVVYGGKNRN